MVIAWQPVEWAELPELCPQECRGHSRHRGAVDLIPPVPLWGISQVRAPCTASPETLAVSKKL